MPADSMPRNDGWNSASGEHTHNWRRKVWLFLPRLVPFLLKPAECFAHSLLLLLFVLPIGACGARGARARERAFGRFSLIFFFCFFLCQTECNREFKATRRFMTLLSLMSPSYSSFMVLVLVRMRNNLCSLLFFFLIFLRCFWLVSSVLFCFVFVLGDSKLFLNVLPDELALTAFDDLQREVVWYV